METVQTQSIGTMTTKDDGDDETDMHGGSMMNVVWCGSRVEESYRDMKQILILRMLF